MTAPDIPFDQVQANILLPYERANCARLLCYRFDPERLGDARRWLREIGPLVTYHADVRDAAGRSTESGSGPWVNLGLTFSGLEALGHDPFALKHAPESFRAGMRARAARLGDPPGPTDGAEIVHALVLLYAFDEAVARASQRVAEDAFHWRPLEDDATTDLELAVSNAISPALACLPRSPAVTHLAELDQDAYTLRTGDGLLVEYFGFRDGVSQPRLAGVPDPAGGCPDSPPGTVLIGHLPPRDDETRRPTRLELALQRWRYGSFLVARRLSQDVEGFRRQAREQARTIPGFDGPKLAEMMLGRRQDGTPLIPPRSDDLDDFDYRDDEEGRRCPFQSHVRRTNPRDERSGIRRIVRRGLPYSSLRNQRPERGLLFLAYNADLESQFEFVQRLWIGSGIQNQGLSRDRDPIAAGPAAADDPDRGKQSFSFVSSYDQRPYTLLGLENCVRLHWGDYFLLPAKHTLDELSQDPASPLAEYARRVRGQSMARARDVLGRWLDDGETGRRLWREVRERGGVVRLPDQEVVLVGTVEHIEAVLHDDGRRYSVCEQGRRMRETTGIFYLGRDACTPEYRRESAANAALVPGWKADLAIREYRSTRGGPLSLAYHASGRQREELAEVRLATGRYCAGFLGLSLVETLARHDRPGPPLRGVLELTRYAAFVLSGLSPRFYGVPQPSIGGTFALNFPASGYVFFPFPEELFLEFAGRAGGGISAYLSSLVEQRERGHAGTLFPEGVDLVDGLPPVPPPNGEAPDETWQARLDEVLGALERSCSENGGPAWTRDDHVRTLAGIVSGMLVASFKLFVDGVSEHVKRNVPVNGPIQVDPAAAARLPFDTLRRRETSMPNVLYRRSVRDQQLGAEEVRAGDFVLVCQGSAMADRPDQEWFYGDRTPQRDEGPSSPHFCPGYLMANVVLETMSSLLFGLKGLRRADESGERLEYDWQAAAELLKALEQRQTP